MKQIISEPKDILGQWLCSRTGGIYTGEGQYIGLVENGQIIACVGFEDYNGASIRMHVAGEGKRWLTRDYLKFCFWYPFEQLKVKKIIGLVSSKNEQALRFDKHLGMVHEATIKDAAPDGDLLILTYTKEQCKFLATSGNPDERTLKRKDNHHGRQIFSTSTT